MKNKSPNGHYPPGVPPGGRLLHIEGSAAERLKAETINKVQPHLNELNQENAAYQSAIGLVFAAAVQKHGVVEVNGPLFLECVELADKLAKQNLRSTHEKARELFLEMKLGDIPAHIVRAAGRQGVEMPTPEDFQRPQLASADVGTGDGPEAHGLCLEAVKL